VTAAAGPRPNEQYMETYIDVTKKEGLMTPDKEKEIRSWTKQNDFVQDIKDPTVKAAKDMICADLIDKNDKKGLPKLDGCTQQ
jgi:hypothetical protein